jgi:16S rRNA (cytosine967-C5)-methyltransferase
MANAVLRKVAEIEVDDGDLRMVSGLPAWLIGRIAEDDGPDAADRLARCNLEPAPVYVFSEHADALAPFSPTATDLDRVYELRKPAGFFSSGLVQSGTVVVSDLAAQHVCAAVAELAGADLLEIGHGSGTKTLIIAQRCDARIAAIDVLPSKVASAQARISRAGLGSRVRSFAFDGTELGGSELPEELGRTFGCVFLDAPCSGTGTMRRHPEIASDLTEADVKELVQLQLQILTAASARVDAGGTLIYATCSVLRAEDEDVVEAFLASDVGHGFELEPVADAPACATNEQLRDLVLSHQTAGGHLLTTPVVGGGDGHFCARFVRKA